MNREIPLKGGRVTPGVVRLDDTVRRPLCGNSPFVHSLLLHLEAVDFPHSPQFLGVDSHDREILTFVDGWVPSDLGQFTIPQLREAARIIAYFHQATETAAIAGSQEVVCHHDLSPCNFVFRSGLPTCIIDFDAAAPGSRRLDVSYAAWLWLDLGNAPENARALGQRLAAFFEAYGAHAPEDPIEAVLEAQEWLAKRAGGESVGSFHQKVQSWAGRCREWVCTHRDGLEAGLRDAAA